MQSCMSCYPIADCVIPRPRAEKMALLQNVNRNSMLFLKAAGIKPNSEEYKKLMITVRALHKEYLHPWKYVEEQLPGLVDKLISEVRARIPWLNRYEDAWPARVYLKRYVDIRRPHLQCTRWHKKKHLISGASEPLRSRAPPKARTKANLDDFEKVSDSDDLVDDLCDNDTAVKDFLSSLMPSLEHRLDAFAELGVKDRKSLEAFVSWPQAIQAEFLDEGQAVLQLTKFEKKNLLLGCSPLLQKALLKSLRT
ncbi:hypothetical protein JVU11DRAFT_800 [Chiua virens]|nr:hypothetical protein JVU11DRAFT_800 [Chiua virens]